jgi:flagellin FlaB
MIAFVIVAAALAFVVLNMGFSTTQKAKTTISTGLGEASSSIEISGKVTGFGCITSAGGCNTTPRLNVTSVPFKVVSGGDAINLGTTSTSIKYLSKSIQYDNIYTCAITSATKTSLSAAFTTAQSETGCSSTFTNKHPITGAEPTSTKAIIYWTVTTSPQNSILDQGEHAVLAIAHGYNPSGSVEERPASLDKVRVEVVLATGAALTVERQVPNITNTVVDMG